MLSTEELGRRIERARNSTINSRCFDYATYMAGVRNTMEDGETPEMGFFENDNFTRIKEPENGCIAAFAGEKLSGEEGEESYHHMGVISTTEPVPMIAHWGIGIGLKIEPLEECVKDRHIWRERLEFWRYNREVS